MIANPRAAVVVSALLVVVGVACDAPSGGPVEAPELAQAARDGATELVVTRDYTRQAVGVVLPFDGSFTAGNGLTVQFWSSVVYTDSGWSAEAVLGFGGKSVTMTHSRDMRSREPGVLRFSDKTPGVAVDPAYGLALGDLAAELYARFPENPRGKEALAPEPLGRGGLRSRELRDSGVRGRRVVLRDAVGRVLRGRGGSGVRDLPLAWY